MTRRCSRRDLISPQQTEPDVVRTWQWKMGNSWWICCLSHAFHFCNWKQMWLGQFCQTKLSTFMLYSPAQLTFTIPTAPALTTVCAVFSIDKEVVVGFPGAIVTGFTIFKQTAASRRKKHEKGYKKSKHVWIGCVFCGWKLEQSVYLGE